MSLCEACTSTANHTDPCLYLEHVRSRPRAQLLHVCKLRYNLTLVAPAHLDGDDRDRTLFEFEKRISHNCSSLVAKKSRFSWVNQDNDRNSEAIESMVESEP